MLQIEAPHAPIEEINMPLFKEKQVQVFIKREDLSHPYISGNKWRKLKYHLLHAEAMHKNTLVTFGGAYSNHLLATAAAGAKYGFRTFGFVRGEQVSNMVLQLCSIFGMQLQFVSRENYRNKEELFKQHFGLNQEALFIPEGGAGELGEQGVAEMLEEDCFTQYTFTDICCSVGTGSTLRGLLRGLQQTNNPAKAHGFVVLKGAENMQEEFAEFAPESFQLHHRFHGGGYAKSDEQLIAYIKKFASSTGILLDQVYEGKMMQGIETLAAENYFAPHSKILALHNGGVIGISGILA
jgi:1-aminocyclopropane-1-carboxylate deaminase